MKWMRRLLIAGCVFSVPLSARAAREELQVQHAWTRPAAAGHSDAVYLSITDHGVPDRLVGVRSAAAKHASLQTNCMQHGVVPTRQVRSLTIPVHKTVTLQPRGPCIVLAGLKHALHAGDSVPVTLTFARAGNRVAVAMVEEPDVQRTRSGTSRQTRMR